MHRSIQVMDDGITNISHGALQDGHQFLETVTMLPQAIDEAFAFFANAENLERLRLFGVPFHWRTRIVEWQPQHQFIDEQIRGPYSSWRHRHTFAESRAGTEMTDRVEYCLPLRPLGSVALPLVRRQLDRIFRYRADAIRRLMAGDTTAASHRRGRSG